MSPLGRALWLTWPPTVTAGTEALSGVEVCGYAADVILGVKDSAPDTTSNCTSSSADGTWTLSGVSANTQFAITFEKEGYLSTLRPIQTDVADIAIAADEINLLPVAQASRAQGTALDGTKGNIEFFAAGTDPVTVTATSFAGPAGPPIYLDPSHTLEPGMFAGKGGLFANIASGYYVLTFKSAAADCTAKDGLYGYPMTTYQAAGEASIVVPVLDGFVTSPIRVDCTKQ